MASGICFVKDGAHVPLDSIAAQESFKQMTEIHLHKLLEALAMRFETGQRPRLVNDIAKCLVKHFFLSASAEEIAAALANRNPSGLLHDVAECSVLAKGDNVDAILEFLDEGDAEEAGAAVTAAMNFYHLC